jgi:DNA-binding PadR family transcriptional regulator
MEHLSRREEQILLAVGYLQEKAYLVAIRKHLSSIMRKEWSIGAIHIPLRRLERQGLIEAHFSEATAVRGGRRKKIYRLTKLGRLALKDTRRIHDILWSNYGHAIPPSE